MADKTTDEVSDLNNPPMNPKPNPNPAGSEIHKPKPENITREVEKL